MGGAHGGVDQEPSFLLSTQASSPQLTPTPSSPHSPQEPKVPVLLQIPVTPPHQCLSPSPGMEAERPQEEDGEQVSSGWGAGLGDQPTEKGHVGT